MQDVRLLTLISFRDGLKQGGEVVSLLNLKAAYYVATNLAVVEAPEQPEEAPTIATSPAGGHTFVAGIPNSVAVTTTGLPVPAIALSGSALPLNLVFADHGDGTATLNGIAMLGTTGSYPVTFTASNGVIPDAATNFSLSVQ